MHQYELYEIDKKEENKCLKKKLAKKRERLRKWQKTYYAKNRDKILLQHRNNNNIKKYSDIKRYYLTRKISHLRTSTRRRSMEELTLTREELLDAIPRDLTCPIFKTKFTFTDNKKEMLSTLSVDRIDNNRGYHKDNIVVVSSRANAIKSAATVKELYQVADFYFELEKKLLDK
tara:strand:- start:7 stop:528 length:522 start_codon:yes stop_codon:yes gene_type:complete